MSSSHAPQLRVNAEHKYVVLSRNCYIHIVFLQISLRIALFLRSHCCSDIRGEDAGTRRVLQRTIRVLDNQRQECSALSLSHLERIRELEKRVTDGGRVQDQLQLANMTTRLVSNTGECSMEKIWVKVKIFCIIHGQRYRD